MVLLLVREVAYIARATSVYTVTRDWQMPVYLFYTLLYNGQAAIADIICKGAQYHDKRANPGENVVID